ncbi:MAG: hypothetical protein H6733_00530 [Alphaproteobacteria bacterium]|nr:hypothetical protein [Alphaproteobacteria bacterium]
MRAWLAGVVVLAACDAPPPPDVDAAGVAADFEALHAAIYDLYALPVDRDALHDLLARAFVGEALTDQYVEHWRTRVRMAEEDTGIQVLGVTYDDVVVLPRASVDDPLRVDATWRVRGVVRHQGHKHPRINRYRAVYTLVDTDAGLRIADTHMKDLARVATQERADAVFGDGPEDVGEDGFMDPLEMFEGGLFDGAPDAATPPEAAP